MKIRWTPGRAAACAALALAGASAARADVVAEQAFADGLGAWSATGSVTTTTSGARLRGGTSPGRLASPAIDVRGLQRVRVTIERSASGLDAGEAATLVATVDGQPRTLESLQAPSGSATFELGSGASTLTLTYALAANSLLETATVARVRIEGDRDTVPPARTGTIVPDASWTCGLPGGIPDPAAGTLVFRTSLAADTPLAAGRTPLGQRRVTRTTGGTLGGGSATGSVLSGALDFDLQLPSGAVEHEARYTLRMSDGTLVYARHCGVADGGDVRFVASFEAPSSSPWQWLNSGTYVGRRQVTSNGVTWAVHAVSATPNPADPVTRVPADAALPQQAFNCPVASATATRGDTALMTARVGIGSSQSVGATPRGRRNIIPITGGTVTGSLAAGAVNPGGADYQLTVNGELQIEARYTLKTGDGETIVVRNCGDFGVSDLTTVLFEARADGPYAALNAKPYAGTITPGLGTVTIRVYERR